MMGGGLEPFKEALVQEKGGLWWSGRAEIDTSAPFESVKEAVDHFGGSGHWKSRRMGQRSCGSHCSQEEINVASVEDEAAQLQKTLVLKERETLEVLKELGATKKVLDGLKLKLYKEDIPDHIIPSRIIFDSTKVHPITEIEHGSSKSEVTNTQPLSPGLILMELKQAKLKLDRTTSDLAGICYSIELINHELLEEKLLVEKTRKRVASMSTLIPNLEKELNQIRFIVELIKDGGGSKNPPDLSRKLHEMRSESEQFRRIAEAAKSDASKLSADIEQARAGIKTAEVRLSAARKMEAAARATESSVRAEIQALTNSGNAASYLHGTQVTLSTEEYNMLVQRAHEAEILSKNKIQAAVDQVEEAMKSKMELLKKVDEVKAEVKFSKKTLSEALLRVEVANKGKLAVEETLRKRRTEGCQRRRSIYNSPRFKNSFPGHSRKESRTWNLAVTGLTSSSTEKVTKSSTSAPPTLSIGQILSRKLVGPEDCEDDSKEGRESMSMKPKVSLAQMLKKRQAISSSETSGDGTQGQLQPKKTFGLARFAVILTKHKKKSKSKRKNKRDAWSPK